MASADGTLPKLTQELSTLHISPVAQPSAISALFPEILCYIFILARPPLEGHSSLDNRLPPQRQLTIAEPGFRQLGSPWSLAQVCSSWRSIALAYGPLWSTIVVPQPNHRACSSFYLKLLLERSGSAPLDVLIRFNGWSLMGEMFHTIVVHRARWRSLWLECDAGRLPPYEFSDSKLGELPLLRYLTLSGKRGLHLNKWFYSMLSDAPNLQSVALRSPGHNTHRHIVLPWAQLTSYQGSYRDPSVHFARLSAASQLVECDLDFGDSNVPIHFPSDLGVVTLPHLRRLVITDTEFLQHLVAPSLQELQVHGVIDHVPSFIHRSACVLTRLTLFMCTSPASQVVTLLQLTSSITALDLDFWGTADGFSVGSPTFFGSSVGTAVLINALTIRADDTAVKPICPRLASLSWGDRHDVLDRESFANMVESRWRLLDPPGQLRFVGMYFRRRRVGR
ncbi:hypothetical protein FB45DRAFT_932802 [Roridomyces roridus]|uniref:F-box domain-containing protein n=1 Tax=Roridomyces roridus TaxID=1738132 RepID=A0AAD7BD95_9AGAR|nr:hypothetical protein FB45DRAFT_932802 [Roridomyces roridus]